MTPRTTELASLFTDHAVLQAERPGPVWGWDAPGRALSLRLASGGRTLHELRAVADASGRFQFVLPATAAGGPYTLRVEGSTTLELADVWFGEVWLASGQSNMEWPVASAANSSAEIASAELPRLRFFKVEPRPSQEPEARVSGRWQVCSPATVADFSAVGFFFARELERRLDRPVGIVDATYGGTCIEAWLSAPALAPLLPDLAERQAEVRAQLAEVPRIRAEYERKVQAWQREHLPSDDENLGLARGWASPAHDDSEWPSFDLPCHWQQQGLRFNGVVWFRRWVEIPAACAGHDLELHLGAIDDFDDTYFNGEPVGSTPPGTVDAHRIWRRYRVPAERVRPGRALIAVRVFDHYGGGGFSGPRAEMYLESAALPNERIGLMGPWRYAVEREIPLVPATIWNSLPPPPPALAQQNTPAALYNGMLAPLVPYRLAGFLWYQGESNTERAASYGALFRALIRDLRTRFGQGSLPFFYVQLANYRASEGWPLLREAQATTRSEPDTGMVVTIDIGDPYDIHPTNKQEVGRRLALLARARTYGEAELAHEGPRLERVRVEGARVSVQLRGAEGLRTRDGGPVRGFALAGRDGRFVAARAEIDGEGVIVTSPEVPEPHAVRYAFAADPDANLENGAGLPAEPFRTDAGVYTL